MKRISLLVLLIIILVIRIWDLGSVPNGFSWDEMDNAYQAYSLFRTGKDIFGNPLPVLLHAFADYKSSLYIYMTIPFVAWGGMNIVTAKMAAVLFGIISISIVSIIAARLFRSIDWGIVAGIVMAISPWWFHYSRLSFEAVGMMAFFLLGVVLFDKKPWVSLVMFALSVWTYSTAKLFAPLILLVLIAFSWKSLGLKKGFLYLAFFGLLVLPVQWQTLLGKGGTRFNEISIFTDPTTATEVNYALEQGQISSGVTRQVGLSPRLVDRLAHNKFTFWLSRLTNNYLTAFSTDFLFIKGDPNLRHSPSGNSIGQFHPTDAIFMVIGLVWLINRKNRWLAIWLVLAPIASAVTRDGGNHATRLLFMLPPLVLVTVAGIRQLNRYILIPVMALHIYFVFAFGYYYFSHFRFESLKPFHWGFDKAVLTASVSQENYENIVFDYHHDSALMAYLASTQYDPNELQSAHPLPQREIVPGYSGTAFGKFTILPPGSRAWSDFLVQPSTLLVLSADQPLPKEPMSQINYPDGTPAFYFLEY